MCFSLVQNHRFVDGNKRVAHAAMETVLILNSAEIAARQVDRTHLTDWLRHHLKPLP